MEDKPRIKRIDRIGVHGCSMGTYWAPHPRKSKPGGEMEVKIWNRSKFIEGMKAQLQVNPKTTALVAVDMHQGHLDDSS